MNPATNLAPKLAQLYPGVYNPDGESDSDGDAAHKLPTKPLNTLLGFDLEGYAYDPQVSEPDRLVFRRKVQA